MNAFRSIREVEYLAELAGCEPTCRLSILTSEGTVCQHAQAEDLPEAMIVHGNIFLDLQTLGVLIGQFVEQKD